MKIIYRVYQIEDEGKCFGWTDFEHKSIVTQEVCLCNSKEDFKEIMKFQWGDIPFRHTKDLKVGDRFISIISYDAYDAEDYVGVEDHTCTECGKDFTANKKRLKTLGTWELSNLEKLCQPLFLEQRDMLNNCYFCCEHCKNVFLQKKQEEFNKYSYEHDLIKDEWISEDTFTPSGGGYIYMISKKSTREFYVGQTKKAPFWRWMQHLKTERFPFKNIKDYVYEILEEVGNNDDILEREAYWINKKYEENPELSLNIQKPKVKEK